MGKFYNSTKFIIILRVKEAVYPVYFTGNMADSAMVHRKPRKNPALLVISGAFGSDIFSLPLSSPLPQSMFGRGLLF